MTRIAVTQRIHASPELVFKAVADIRQFSRAVPDVVRYEILSPMDYGLGTRFRLTRLMSGHETTLEFEAKEFVENQRVRLVTDDQMGTVWDSVFTVQAQNAEAVLTMTMEAHCYKWMAKVVVFSIMGTLKHAVERDMAAIKAFCERVQDVGADQGGAS